MSDIDDARLDMILHDVRHIRQLLEAQNGRVRRNSERIAVLETRTNTMAVLQATLSILLSSAAAWLGVRH